MNRVNNIIARVRDTLSDSDEDRYTTGRLLRVLSEAQSKISKDALCLRYKCTVELCDGHHTYKLDSSAVETNGGQPVAIYGIRNHAGKPCRFVTEEFMDRTNPTWMADTGSDITHIVYDKQQPLLFRVYPKPDATKLGLGLTFNTVDNPVTAAGTIVQPLGTASNFDITAEVTPVKLLVDFYLSPPNVTTLADDNLLVSDHYDEAIKHYVTGLVLRDDKDTQNRQFGMEELKLYTAAYDVAKATTERDFVDQRHESYTPVKFNAEI